MNGLIAVVESEPGSAGFPLVAKHQSGKLCSDAELKSNREYCEMLTGEINEIINDPIFLKGAQAYKRLSTRKHILKVVLPYHISSKDFLDYRLASVLPIEAEARVRHTVENKKSGKLPDSHFITENKQSLINKQIEIVDDLSLGSMVFGVFFMGLAFLIAGLLRSLFSAVRSFSKITASLFLKNKAQSVPE